MHLAIMRRWRSFGNANSPCLKVCVLVRLLKISIDTSTYSIDSVYLDHSGTTLYSKSLVAKFSRDMISGLYGNPHSASASSDLSTARVEDVRLRLLKFFNADQADFDLVFVPNATSGIKLVMEAFRSAPGGFSYAYHQACHTSVVGMRAEATKYRCLDTPMVEDWLSGKSPFAGTQSSTVLFSYSAQSHMNGKRYPLSWASRIRSAAPAPSQHIYSLLDVASYAATSPLDLSDGENAPDFVVLSLYKIFGFPDLGALIVRRAAEPVLRHRKYFGGGTVDMVLCGRDNWHAVKNEFIHERLEDGTLPFHNIIAVDAALETHQALFGTMERISKHTEILRYYLYRGLTSLRHSNGRSVCAIYSENPRPNDAIGAGPIVSFNIRNSDGSWVSLHEFEKLVVLQKIHVRTGSVCSPCDVAAHLDLNAWEMKRSYAAGLRCGGANDLVRGSPTGVIRASLGAMSTKSDIDRFISFISEFYREGGENQPAGTVSTQSPSPSPASAPLILQDIIVYPIKSCGGYKVPYGVHWEVKPEGLAWDREWCLIHEGSGQALSQKRYPRMALLCPTFDFKQGLLRVEYCGESRPNVPNEMSFPLSAHPDLFGRDSCVRETPSRVCGETVTAQTYTSRTINSFFTQHLGVPCLLAHFPPGGNGPRMRFSKASTSPIVPSPENSESKDSVMPGSFPLPPSPPDSDSEQLQQRLPPRILLSNESPILLVHAASVEALNKELARSGKSPVPAAQFRPNIIVGPGAGQGPQSTAYTEDSWHNLRLGPHRFSVLGPCRRCQMVCVDQETAQRSDEPFVTLAKTRRTDGKVYFGVHMALDSDGSGSFQTVQVGDSVFIEDD